MNELYHTDDLGTCHVSDQGVIELAYSDLLQDAMFEWQNPQSKQQYEQVSAYLDSWPAHIQTPHVNQRVWFTPEPYDALDLKDHVMSRCVTPEEKQRALCELKIIEHVGAMNIFKHLVYLVDTWRSQGSVWGVGRGSSVSCFVLYVIGVNRINPLDYDLCMTEFFKLTPDQILNILNAGDSPHGQNIT